MSIEKLDSIITDTDVKFYINLINEIKRCAFGNMTTTKRQMTNIFVRKRPKN